MKYIKFLIVAIVAMCAASCVEGYEDTGFTPKTPEMSFNVAKVDVNNEAQEITVKLSSNLPWMLSSDATWASVSPTRGEAGEEIIVTIKVQRNRTVEERTATLTATIVKDATCSMEVVQAPAEAGNAAIYYVKTTGTKENSGLSWANATTLSNAIYNAADGDTIYVAEGVYTPEDYVGGYEGDEEGYKTFELHSNFSLIGGFPADVTDDTFDAESMYSPKEYVVTLSGTLGLTANAYHVVTVSAPQAEGKKAVLKGVTICDGVASDDFDTAISIGSSVAAHISRGAGVVIGASTFEMTDCVITDNASSEHVGGIYALMGGVITMDNCIVRNNTAVNNCGGMWNSGATVYMYDCLFDSNRSGQQAAAYYSIAEQSNPLGISISRIYNSSFINNNNNFDGKTGRMGGAIYFRAWTDALMVNCTIAKNESTGGGGAIEIHSGSADKSSDVTLVNTTISSNSAVSHGGGVGIYNAGTSLTLYNTIISGNTCSGNAASNDFGKYADNVETTVSFYNSIVGNALYGADGQTISGASFDASTMLSALDKWNDKFNDTYSYKLVCGESNPACSQGMATEDLVGKLGGFDPAVDTSMLDIDQRGVTRTKATIGATTCD